MEVDVLTADSKVIHGQLVSVDTDIDGKMEMVIEGPGGAKAKVSGTYRPMVISVDTVPYTTKPQ